MSSALLDRQSPDGGWSFRRGGGSWTEPTCYALLALLAQESGGSEAARRGFQWLASRQRADGGWSPRDSVDQSTWVTALALLMPPDVGMDRSRAVVWLLAETGRESTLVQRLRWRLLGVPVDPSQQFDGWPWYPGAAAWVMPTALSLLALRKMESFPETSAAVHARVEQGRAFLLARRCRDGGWNHGSTKALGYDSDSYPETTGLAVLALHGSRDAAMTAALAVAERHLQQSTSLEASSWLTLALLAWGRRPPALAPKGNGGTIEIALSEMARSAAGGRHILLG